MTYLIYSTPACSYCTRAKVMLRARGLDYEERDAVALRAEMQQRVQAAAGSTPTTVPQIFRGAQYVGGFDQLKALLEAEAKEKE